MFNKDFYPTYETLAKKMLEPHLIENRHGMFNLKCTRLLEPQAGKGDILDYICSRLSYSNKGRAKERKLFAIEKEPALCAILKEKKYRVIGTDFLEFNTHLSFDLIVMNPPFSAGAKHLIQAWNISKGGHIVCLLNAATYDNAYTDERKYLKNIIDANGSVERLGKAFASTRAAERTTNAEIILVRLIKPKVVDEKDFIFSGLEGEHRDLGSFDNINELADRNVLKSYEISYNLAIEAKKECLKAEAKLEYYRRDICKVAKRKEVFKDGKPTGRKEMIVPKTDYAKEFQKYVEESNIEAWQVFLAKSKFTGYLTSKVRREFDRRFQTQKILAFTENNMRTMLETLFFSQDSLLLGCIEEAFDEMTKYYKYNRIIDKTGKKSEGWKTNDCWRVNKKVILPNRVSLSSCSGFSIAYSTRESLNDIDRAMCYVSGLQYENIETIASALQEKFKDVESSGYSTKNNLTESTFFKMRFYKKGTIHLYFKDEYFWSQFNRKAAEKKGFPLPARMSFDAEYPAFVEN